VVRLVQQVLVGLAPPGITAGAAAALVMLALAAHRNLAAAEVVASSQPVRLELAAYQSSAAAVALLA